MTIGTNLKKCRTARSLTQEELAQRLHVTRQTVSSWKRNNSHPDLDQLASIAAALDTEVTVLLYGPENPARPTPRQALRAAVPAALAVVLGVAGIWLTPWGKGVLYVGLLLLMLGPGQADAPVQDGFPKRHGVKNRPKSRLRTGAAIVFVGFCGDWAENMPSVQQPQGQQLGGHLPGAHHPQKISRPQGQAGVRGGHG